MVSYTGLQQINFIFNVSEDSIDNCSLIINSVISLTNDSVNSSITQQFTKSLNVGEYDWKIRCVDLAGNETSGYLELSLVGGPGRRHRSALRPGLADKIYSNIQNCVVLL